MSFIDLSQQSGVTNIFRVKSTLSQSLDIFQADHLRCPVCSARYTVQEILRQTWFPVVGLVYGVDLLTQLGEVDFPPGYYLQPRMVFPAPGEYVNLGGVLSLVADEFVTPPPPPELELIDVLLVPGYSEGIIFVGDNGEPLVPAWPILNRMLDICYGFYLPCTHCSAVVYLSDGSLWLASI